jgi:RTX calcium-binding nonapeptide repeat (4 copies)
MSTARPSDDYQDELDFECAITGQNTHYQIGELGEREMAGEALTAKQAPYRHDVAPALGLRAGSSFVSVVTQAVLNIHLEESSMYLKHWRTWLNRSSKTAQRGRRRGTAKATPREPNLWRPVLECLEDRTLLSATLSLNGTQTLVPNTNIDVTDNATPSEARKATTNESEMVVDINPTNPLNVVGFVHNTSNLNQIQVFFSTNAGANWTRRLITNTTGAGIFNDGFGQGTRFDPALKFDANGTLYVAYGIDNSVVGSFNGFTRLVVATSTDGGNTFTRFRGVDLQANIPVMPVKGVAQAPIVGVDKWQIATGLSGPNSTAQAVYVAYKRFNPPSHTMIAGSTDGGATFTIPRAVEDSAEHVGSDACPAVGPNGELYVTWAAGQSIFVDRDLDGLWSNNQTFGTDVSVRTLNFVYDLTSITAQPRRGIGNGPVLEVDRSGGVHNGRLYVAFVDSASSLPANANDTDIYLLWSDDRGVTWTTQTGRGNVQGSVSTDFLPWVAVDQNTGSVNVAYYTTAGAPDNTQVNLRLASSTNGGVSFQKADVTTSRSQASSMSYSGEFLEYIGVAVRDGTAQAFWADNRGATQGTFVGDSDSYSASVASRSPSNTLTIKGDGNLNDVITLRNDPLNSNYAQVIVNGKIQWAGLWASIGRVDINGMNGNDIIDIENTVSGVPVTVDTSFGDDTVYLSRDAKLLRNIAGNVTIYGDNTDDDQLIINDQSDTVSTPTIAVTRNTVRESKQAGNQSFTTGLITLAGAGFRRGVTINGGSGGNTFVVNGTQTFATTLNTGSGPDMVNVLATTGALTVNGQSGTDTVNIGSGGSVRNIGNTLTVTNSGGYSSVSVDDSADNQSRTVILYNNGTYNVLSGFPTGGDILLQRGQLRSLAISAGSSVVNGTIVGGNTFRIHDTPYSLSPGGVTTTVRTGKGPDNVTIDGTTGALALDAQGAGQGANFISVGSATANLDRINGPINITGPAGAENDLSVNDSASITSHQFVIDRDFVQRGGRARIGYQNMSQLTVRTAAQPDHIIVQDTAPFAIGRSTSIVGGGNDVIDVGKTTGTLLIGAGGTSAITVGNATSSLANIQGVIGVTPSAGSLVTLSLNDQAETTTQQLDVVTNFFGFPRFQRSGAAVINVLSSSLAAFSWFGGSGGNTVNVKKLPAPASGFTLGGGGDVVNLGTTANQLFNTGTMHIVGGAGADQLLLRDDGTTTPQRYDVGNFPIVGRETLGVITAHPLNNTAPLFKVFFEFVESVSLNGGSGGNFVKVGGTPTATSVQIHTGAGDDTVDVASNTVQRSLGDIRGPLTLDGQGDGNQVTFDDSGATTAHNYSVSVDQLVRADSPSGTVLPPVTFSNFKTVTLNAGAGGNGIEVDGTAAGTTLVINGGAGPDLEVISLVADQNSLLGPIALHIQPGAFDVVEYVDSNNSSPQTYTFTDHTISRSGQADVTYDGAFVGAFGIELLEPTVGGNKTYVRSVAAGSEERSFDSNGDQVIVGSQAPNTGGDLKGILGFAGVAASDPNAQVALVIDDSGNMDTTPQQVVFYPVRDADNFINMTGLAPIGWNLPSTSSVKVLGGAADETFVMQPIVSQTPVTIVGGTGINTLDYSAYTTGVTVNLATGVATDLAGIANIRNAIGGSGNDVLTGSALGSVLVGGAGNDVLTGGAGRNILVGGSGMDTLNGGNAGDILIGGLLSYYDEATRTVDTVALDALLAEWSRTDLSYQDRVNHLNGSVAGGLNGPYVLNDTTVSDDGVVDAIVAGAGQNWLLPS